MLPAKNKTNGSNTSKIFILPMSPSITPEFISTVRAKVINNCYFINKRQDNFLNHETVTGFGGEK